MAAIPSVIWVRISSPLNPAFGHHGRFFGGFEEGTNMISVPFGPFDQALAQRIVRVPAKKCLIAKLAK